MKARDYTPLMAKLAEAYAQRSPRSKAMQDQAVNYLVDGGSHTLRLIKPFPPRIASARGAWLTDEDGHRIMDLWQGHMANILGHNPPEITTPLAEALGGSFGLQTGFTDALQVDTARILCQQTGAERVRFTTSGSLATMYAIMLGRAFTGRELVLKVGGGWHGSQPWALKGIDYHGGVGNGYQAVESNGVPAAVTDQVLVTPFNDPERLRDLFRASGDQMACFIMEPFIGVGGYMPASPEFVRAARELTQQYGVVLILDEVIAGFRFRAGNMGALYGIQPDLATFGKIIGGGMPVAAVAGRAEIMELAGVSEGGSRAYKAARVKFSGGTYSAHPASMLAARTMMAYLVDHEAEIYPRLGKLGDLARRTVRDAFAAEEIYAHVTGGSGMLSDGNAPLTTGSSMFMLHFPFDPDRPLVSPSDCFDPARCDIPLCHTVLDLAMLVEDVFMLHSHAGLSTAHTEADIAYLGEACRRAARRIKPYL
jgi:glutamate-1-semialdehyde 2,1-aminomutase